MRVCTNPFVPALGIEGRAKGLHFFTYQLLELEGWTVKRSVDWARRLIPDLFELERLRSRYEYSGRLIGNGIDLSEVIRRFVDRVHDSRLIEIKTILGPKHTQDAFHLFVCEENGLDGFITLDLKLKRHFEQLRKRLKSLKCSFHPKSAKQSVSNRLVQNGSPKARKFYSQTISCSCSHVRHHGDDKIAYASYRSSIYLRNKHGVKVNFVIPGY